MKLILSLLLALLTSTSWAISDCQTHQSCTLDQPCECIVSAESSNDRHFYLEFSELVKGHTYQCQLNDSLGDITAVLGNSHFPNGSTWQLPYQTSHFPMTLIIDTASQTQASDNMSIKYFVPASDMPNVVSVNCITIH
jgi:hypothetical protein